MKDFIKLKIVAGIFAYMNENIILMFYCTFYIFSYFLMKMNKKFGLIFSLLFFFLPLFFYNSNLNLKNLSIIFLWGLFSSGYVIFKYFSKESHNTRIEYLNEIRKNKELWTKNLYTIKLESANIAEVEKKTFITYSITKMLSEALNIKEISQSLYKYLLDYFNVNGGISFYIYDEIEKQEFELVCGEELKVSLEYLEEKSKGENYFIDNGKFYFLLKEDKKISGFIAVPLAKKEDIDKIKKLAEDLFSEIYAGIRRLRLFNSIEILSRIDGLTGVYRRGSFDIRIKEEFDRAKAFKTSLGLMIIDIDHFKKINDIYGHQAGDIVLRSVAKILKESVYETDFVARYGGEEFAIILPRAEFSGALRKAEYLREKIEHSIFDIGFQNINVTISIGIAHYPRDASNISQLIEMADKALYKAKSLGRNRVVDISQV